MGDHGAAWKREILFRQTDAFVENAGLKVDESALTGESLGVDKDKQGYWKAKLPLGDRLCMVYSGSYRYLRAWLSSWLLRSEWNTEVGKIATSATARYKRKADTSCR